MTHSKTTTTNLKKLKADGAINITKDEETYFTQDTLEDPTILICILICIFTDGSKMEKKEKTIKNNHRRRCHNIHRTDYNRNNDPNGRRKHDKPSRAHGHK